LSLKHTLIDFLVAQALVWVPMILGHRLQSSGPWGRQVGERIARPLHAFNIKALVPGVFLLGIWKLERAGDDWWRVPSVYAAMLVFSGIVAYAISPRLFRRGRSIGTHFLLVTISNIAHTLAGFLTILLIGADAYPLNAILMLPSCLFIFLVWLPLATRWGHDIELSFGLHYRRIVFSSLSLPLVGIAGGLALNFSGAPMAAGWTTLMKVLVFLATALTMFAIGCRLRLRHALRFRRALRWLHVVKFAVHPAIVVAICLLIGLRGTAAGVLLIAATMPSGVMPIQLSSLQKLDVDLANAGFLLTTVFFMVVVLPMLLLLIQLPMFH
jgi:hypothetical protein